MTPSLTTKQYKIITADLLGNAALNQAEGRRIYEEIGEECYTQITKKFSWTELEGVRMPENLLLRQLFYDYSRTQKFEAPGLYQLPDGHPAIAVYEYVCETVNQILDRYANTELVESIVVNYIIPDQFLENLQPTYTNEVEKCDYYLINLPTKTVEIGSKLQGLGEIATLEDFEEVQKTVNRRAAETRLPTINKVEQKNKQNTIGYHI